MIAMGFLILIGAAFLLLLAVAGILFVGFCALVAGGVGFWWWRSRKPNVKPTAFGSASLAADRVEDQESRSGR